MNDTSEYLKKRGQETENRREQIKKIWQLTQLPFLTLIIVGALLWSSQQQQETAQRLSGQQQSNTIAREKDQQDESRLVNYMNNIGDMLVHNNLLQARGTDIVKAVAQAQTQATLVQLDPVRKAVLIHFLYDTKLISNDYHVISLVDIDVHNAEMQNLDLRDTYLVGCRLNGSDLRNTNLSYATLVFADLSNADMAGADLHASDMHNINLAGADLAGANLKDVTGLTNDQLSKARSLNRATMPDGSRHA